MRLATSEEKHAIATDLLGDGNVKSDSLRTFFNLYDSVTTPHYATIQIHPPVLSSHENVRKLVLELRGNPRVTRAEFRRKCFSDRPSDPETVVDQEYAINIAVQLLLMVDCFDKNHHSENYEIGGFRPVSWGDSEQFVDFANRTFPINGHDEGEVRAAMKEKNALKCWKLKKRARIKFLATDNLAEHLLYDPRDNVVRIFRQTAFLKAQLRRSAALPLDNEFSKSLELGFLPPQLLLETMHSLQSILFPPVDEKSSQFLESIIQDPDVGFDPDCLFYEGYGRPIPGNFEYHYWGNRLAKLHHVVTNPRPTHRIGQWIQRHSSERNALLIAILSLVLSAFFGFLSVILGFVQTWLAYKSWKAQTQVPPS